LPPVIGAVTSAQVCQPPVPGTSAVPTTGPSGASARISIRPPALADATRKRIESMPVRLAGSSDHQSPSSMKPMF
jgi:hypothetical protein